MEELLKALGPWPVAQGIVIGLLVAAAGFWAIRRGLQDNQRTRADDGEARVVRIEEVLTVRVEETLPVRVEHTDEEKRWQWEAYKQLGHLETNSFQMVKHSEDSVELLREILKSINRLADVRWNSRQ
ncbi:MULTISPECIES: hypothetical protein [unclassified Bradyrhizobium]|uniref:hypothetical protein n=1 Tax=unclassified Bradyrhizobium TaxID=2631580 RepID=UPI001FFA4183|nr:MULTISPECIES: hypothetical protein [unclassified Bradyrhizobium]MCK1503140.1 hypothetical protein [Bradyrhizobium sp. 188]MCK1569006.1 hypothetical protein [Bradyrhizobium sp. 173]MCK1676661.1 hypothetical protein [Bradyrhizobium sp. 150]UPJ30320.1 hypothetical protein IVB54_15545 [Bradyrhizobium sp. CW1]